MRKTTNKLIYEKYSYKAILHTPKLFTIKKKWQHENSISTYMYDAKYSEIQVFINEKFTIS